MTAPLGTFLPPSLEIVLLRFIIDVDKCLLDKVHEQWYAICNEIRV